MDRSEVWMSLAATPPCVSAVVTAVARVLSSANAWLAVASVTLIPTERVRMFGVPVARPEPWTVSLGDDPPQVALAATGSDGEDEQAATATPAVSAARASAAARATRGPVPRLGPGAAVGVPAMELVCWPIPEQTWARGAKFPGGPR